MTGPEIKEWRVVQPTMQDMVDFRVHRAHFGVPFHYVINAKLGSVTFRLVSFTTSAPLNNQLRDACINLARCLS